MIAGAPMNPIVDPCTKMPARRGATKKRKLGYFQFPLCLLAFLDDYENRLQHIVAYCLCEHAQRFNPTLADTPSETRLYAAARFLHVNMPSPEATIHRWKTARSFIRQWEDAYGPDALVRIGTTLLWEAHDHDGLTYREFSILCAINSVIGDRSTPVRITEGTIRIRAAGYKSFSVVRQELNRDKSRAAQLLTPHKARYTLERLHERRLFARARVRAKTVKYMVGKSDDELRKILLQTETHRSRFKHERARKDRELMMMIKSKAQTGSRTHPQEEE